MPNGNRGDAHVMVDGAKRTIRLTLGAIAEIEDDLGVGLASLDKVMAEGNIKPITTILYWMLRAGGWADLQKEDLLTADIPMDSDMMTQIQNAMQSFTGGGGGGPRKEGKKKGN